MDTLPTAPTSQGVAPSAGSMAKEVAPLTPLSAEMPTMTEIGKEVEFPAEVVKAGVRMSSDTIELPLLVQQMGVQSLDPAAAKTVQPSIINLPLSDEQIAKGLHQSMLSSWRWLSEWCKRQLQQAHLTIKSLQGKTVRMQE